MEKEKINKDNKQIENQENGSKKTRFKSLVVNGAKYRTMYTKKYENRVKWEKPNAKKVLSVIPGTIDKLYVNKGDSVKKEDKILILEAMKMKNTIFSPVDGKVKDVYVKIGDKVPKGFLILEFD